MSVIKKVLISRDELNEKVKELGNKISMEYEGKDLIMVGVLKGGFIFLADLIRELKIPVEIDFISVSSYGSSSKSSGVVRIIKDIDVSITNKHVIIVEDIIDTGLTLKYLKEMLYTRGPLDVKIIAALDKPSRRKVDIDIDYKGFTIPDEFVVGYGLDYASKYRNLPDVCILNEEIYKS
ncbi:hypoxanthine phosphoribosyltransferase [Pseudobacteroides cellulosolvens]|uniref:Hypoxanthine phosphoribosyltransferase n=1 Tax=Pseudobacteroides cellulosolvens ATCC 35603 = DSM 2933 TaxID=398512 RepID=A0A0L6JT92_9FIRM|nr:hypoxanthine phosphoribosyltransferase [Pseudobacteroides cellulosolvens]KNY28637.1 hypoxanthine phosphoribosyltransferase [Pseudobacteroides cellulosolvens ATCC 35603 = DSM 2933]